MQLPQLPIQHSMAELKNALGAGSALLAAPPGSGKTTIVPLALLEEEWLANNKILILQPRRLATRAAAARMAAILGEQIGKTVGYQIRFDRRISKNTRIEVLTEGILTRRIQNDVDLQGVGLIIFDEFHERSVHGDLALALCLDLCQVKEDLRLLVMSATLDTAPIARLLGDVPVVIGEGQNYEVRVEYLERQIKGKISEITMAGISRLVAEQQGDILVFLPGIGEIKDVYQQLLSHPVFHDILISPLFGDLSQGDQDRAILPDPAGRRRIILATSIAETSLTIEGISCVLDSGWSRRPRFSPGNGLSTLTTVRVSRAAAEQRAGRAGRLGPGYCLRLWTRGDHYNLIPFHPPEIVEVDLASLVLELALWGVKEAEELRWLDVPRSGPYQQALKLLQSLKAIDRSGKITDTGKQLAALPLHPRLGHMLLRADRLQQGPLACDLAAILSERDIVSRDGRDISADLQIRLRLLRLWREKKGDVVNSEGGDPAICRRVDRAASQYQKLIGAKQGISNMDMVGNILAYAYPDRIARRRPDQWGQYLLATGRRATLPAADLLFASEYLVVPHLDAREKEGRIFLAHPLDIFDIRKYHRDLFSDSREVYWDNDGDRVVAVRRLRLQEITIEKRPLADVAPGEISKALLTGIGRMGLECLGWDRKIRQFQVRVNCLRSWQPEIDWPDLTDSRLLGDLSWLEPYLAGVSRKEQLRKIDLLEIFKAMLGWEKQQKLEQDAPESILVPSGSKIRIDYRVEEPPLLAVRIQEMFGQTTTPTICNGEIVVLMHLLSPARRPVQVTSDLAGFWQRSYPEIRKELKGRYPKHFWPNDPMAAEPTRGVKRKMKSP